MSALTDLMDRVDVPTLINHYNLDYISAGNQLRMACPIHGGNNTSSFVIDVEKGVFFCHSCGAGGDIFNLICEIEKKDFAYALRLVSTMFNIEIGEESVRNALKFHEKEFQSWKKMLRKEMSTFSEFVLQDVEMKNVLTYRSFMKETLDEFGVKLIPKVELTSKSNVPYYLTNYLSFPIIWEGKNIGYALRATDNSTPKWSLQPPSAHFGGILYNFDRMSVNDEYVVIVEGIKDVMAFHEIGITAVCVFGAHITLSQYETIIKCGKDVVTCFDGDDAGRKATSTAMKMMKNKCRLYTIHMDEGEDAESIDRKELYERWKNKKLLTW
jgi:DNA primase